ncbi:MAG: hypothetical protein QOH61_566 [Chloroflexota bacterium]|nr:hypothetical protein [Chloroflexota bacterium]
MTQDLTRWNRAGLSRFTYVDANAVTLLERLREEVVERFGAEWDPAPPKAADLMERYAAVPHGDAGWELLRALARATHIVCAHVDAYANEAFLRTATQSESLRRLVALLDYHPAPASSASTTLAFDAKADAAGPTTVPAGTAVRYQPAEGAPVVFETLLSLDVVPGLNRLRVVGADANPHPLTNPFTLETDVPVVTGDPLVLTDGQKRFVGRISSVARDASDLPVVSITPFPKAHGFTIGRTTAYTDPKDRLSVVGPTDMSVSSDSGGWLRLGRAVTGIRKGDVVWISGGSTPDFRKVEEVGSYAVRLDSAVTGAPLSALVGAALPVEVDPATGAGQVKATGDWQWLRGRSVGVGTTVYPGSGDLINAQAAMFYYAYQALVFDAESAIRPVVVDPAQLTTATVTAATFVPSSTAGPNTNKTTFTLSPAPPFTAEYLFVQPEAAAASGIPVEAPLVREVGILISTLTTSEVARTEVGDWFVLGGESGDLVGKAVAVNAGPGPQASVSVDGWSGEPAPLEQAFHPATTRGYGHFNASSRIAAWNRNDLDLEGATTVLLDAVPAELVAGRPVVVEDAPPPEDVSAARAAAAAAAALAAAAAAAAAAVGSPVAAGTTDVAPPTAISTRVLAVSRTAGAAIPGSAAVTFADPVPVGATVGSLLVRGNAVTAGHGRSMPAAVVGSGSAERVNQRFSVPATDVSTVPDPSFPSGVRLDVELTIEGRRWQQVPTLRDAEPDAFAFTAHLGDDGRPELVTGDGVNGRRVPTGRDNVICSWRVGSGVEGIVPSGSLIDLVRPINGIDGVAQPLASSGGGSGDSADAIRENAPRSVLALERAVSLDDFEALAAGRADVWQARARQLPTAQRGASVELVVVPAGAGPLSAAQKDAIRSTLEAAALPGTSVSVRGHRAVPLELSITIAVKYAAYDPERVRRDTLARVTDRFSSEARRLGQAITREEVVLVAEQIDGVENATCHIGQSTADAASGIGAVVRDSSHAIRLVRAEPDELISVQPSRPAVSVVPQEYRL